MLIEVNDLKVHFDTRTGMFGRGPAVPAVDGVSFAIARGETLALVGESGSGKSTLGRAVLRLTEPTSGTVRFDGDDLTKLNAGEMRARRRRMQMIFQDPYASLNPKMRVRQTVAEPLRAAGMPRREVDALVAEMLETVGLDPRDSDRYPREFSGGQRQRVAIARALASGPEFLVADEPLASLDVSIQAQIMNLLRSLQRERGLTYLFISHDLRAVRRIADRIAVMYLGRIVELGPAEEVSLRPLMPYTKALVSAVPVPDPMVERSRRRIVLREGSPTRPLTGCPFRPRCPWAIEECGTVVPNLREIRPAHLAACIRVSPEKPYIED